jgi:hypothetical protein
MQPGISSHSRLRGDYALSGGGVAWVLAWRTNEFTDKFPACMGWDAGICAVRLPSWRVVATTRSDLRHDDGIAARKICHGDWILTRIRW